MPNIKDIRRYMGAWEKYSYAEGLNYCFDLKKDERLFQLTKNLLEILKIKDMPMNGFSIEHIAKQANNGKTKIFFSDLFYESANNFITPVSYLAKMVEAYENKDIFNEYILAGEVARGLRAFPSFIREMDLEYKLSEVLINVECIRNPEQDIQNHTDVLIRYDGQEYRVWSYQVTPRGLKNTAKRLLGQRGKLPLGIHILCPIDIYNRKETEDISGWKLYSDSYIHKVVTVLRQRQIDKYSEIIRKSTYEVKEYIKEIHKFEKGG